MNPADATPRNVEGSIHLRQMNHPGSNNAFPFELSEYTIFFKK